MGIMLESALGGAGASVALGAFARGYLGTGVLSVQITATLCLLCGLPLLRRARDSVPSPLAYVLGAGAGVGCVLPALYALLVELFTGHQRPGSSPVEGIWRIFAILFLWGCFAKLNEGYIRPALAQSTWFQSAAGSIGRHTHAAALGKRERALEDIKERLIPVIVRRKKAEKLVVAKEPELEASAKNIARAHALLEKGQARLAAANAAAEDYVELTEEVEGLQAMAKSAEAYHAGLETQIETAKQDIKECKEIGEKMQAEWTEALHINNHVDFYR